VPGPRLALGHHQAVALDLPEGPNLPGHLTEAPGLRDQDLADQFRAVDEVQADPADPDEGEVAVLTSDLHGEAEWVPAHGLVKGNAEQSIARTGRVFCVHAAVLVRAIPGQKIPKTVVRRQGGMGEQAGPRNLVGFSGRAWGISTGL